MCRGANEALGAASVEEAATDDSYSHRARAPAYRATGWGGKSQPWSGTNWYAMTILRTDVHREVHGE
jgi:hypothetical protein